MKQSTPPKEAQTPPKGGNPVAQWLCSHILKVFGWSVEGNIPQHPKMVIAVAPHTSNWDFFLGVVVLFYLRIKIKFVGKHTIFKPGLKQLLEIIGGIPVDRRSAHGVVNQIVDEFERQEKMIFAIAPEGTRSPVYPWKTGFVAIAHKANVPIVPIGFDFKKKKVVIGSLITTSGDTEQDMQRVYAFFKTINAKYPEDCLFE